MKEATMGKKEIALQADVGEKTRDKAVGLEFSKFKNNFKSSRL
jgi:hypothetical protein